MKPLAIDLFCGLFQSELFPAANATVKKLVARRTEKPDHMALRVGHDAPSPIPLELWLVRYLKDAIFATGFAGHRQIGASPPKSVDDRVLEGSARVIDLLDMRLAAMKFAALLPSGLARALFRAIATVGAGRHNLEMLRAAETVAAGCRHVELLFAPYAPSTRLAFHRAIELVGTLRREATATIGAKQIIHQVGIA